MKFNYTKLAWRALTFVVVAYSLFVTGRNLIHAVRIDQDTRALMRDREYYLEKIEQDSTIVEQLKYDDYIEKYAREHFKMQRPGEQVFIIED